MDLEMDKNIKDAIRDSTLIKQSLNGSNHGSNGGATEIIDLSKDSPRRCYEEEDFNLAGLESDSEDNAILMSCSNASFDLNQAYATTNQPHIPLSDNGAVNFLPNTTTTTKKNETDEKSANTTSLERNGANGEGAGDEAISTSRMQQQLLPTSNNKKASSTSVEEVSSPHLVFNSIESVIDTLGETLSKRNTSISLVNDIPGNKVDSKSKYISNNDLNETKTVTKIAAIEAVSAIVSDSTRNEIIEVQSNDEVPAKRARRSCVERKERVIDLYKEEESETTCTMGSDEDDSEESDEDADESSVQEDGEKGNEKIKHSSPIKENGKDNTLSQTKGKRGRPRKNQPSPTKKGQDGSGDEDSDIDIAELPEDTVDTPRLRKRKRGQRGKDPRKMDAARRHKESVRKLTQIFGKTTKERTTAEKKFLASQTARAINEAKKRSNLKQTIDDRKREIEDPEDVLNDKCLKLANAISKAKNLVVYTGAGISTAADIPDYRGPNGIWTLLDQGAKLNDTAQFGDRYCRDLALARPTATHMALFTLYKRGRLKHIVSQNCDGLHLRSGIPRYAMSELHGNMFVEICKRCKPMRPFIRLFDVTERTSKHRHTTMRRCHVCGESLFDTIVHFGEKGSLKWPLNWDGAGKAAEKADVILCLGSSLKVLRRYTWLWCMDRPKKDRPKLYIANLQWTPKDSAATIKINGRCDDIMKRVMENLSMIIPKYCGTNDPLLSYTTPLHPLENHTTSRQPINSIPYIDTPEEEFDVKPEIKTDIKSIDTANLDLKTTLNGILSLENSWVLDHPYCVKLLEVKVKQEQEKLVDRIKEEPYVGLNPIPIEAPPFKHSIATILGSGIVGSPRDILERIHSVYANASLTPYPASSPSNGTGCLPGNSLIKTENGQVLDDSYTPLTSKTSSATTSRTSSPPLPRRMSTRKKKENPAMSMYNQVPKPTTKPVNQKTTTSKNGLVKSSKVIDYASIKWPRDALYIPYTYPEEFNSKDNEKEPYKFEYIHELEANDEPAYYCDCCDPSRQPKPRKRRRRKHSTKKPRSGSSDSSGNSSNSNSSSSSSSSDSSSSSSSSSSSESSSDDDSAEENTNQENGNKIEENGCADSRRKSTENNAASKDENRAKRKKKKKSSKSRNERKEDDSNNESLSSTPTTPNATSTLKPIGWYGKGRKSGNRNRNKNKL